MGKNRKPRNTDHGQMHCISIETENKNQEIPLDFLTSDDFCIVHKKKSSKKNSNDEEVRSRSRSNSGKKSVQDEINNCHSGFWASKSNGSVNDCLTSNGSVNQAGEEVPEGNLKNCVDSNFVESHDNVFEVNNFDCAEETEEKEDSIASLMEDNENVPINFLKQEGSHGLSSIEQPYEQKSNVEVPVTINGHVKRKQKKKKNLRKESFDEVENILKELDSIDQKHQVLSKCSNPICTSDKHLDQTSMCCINNISAVHNVDNIIPNNASNESEKFELLSNNLECDCKLIENNLKTTNFDENHIIKSEILNIESKPSSPRKKDRKAKAKTKIASCHAEVTDLKSQDSVKINNDVNLENKEEKKIKESVKDSDRKGKRPSKKQLAIIHEALRKAREEQERQQKEEEARQKMAEEAERVRLEKLQIEQEKKEKKKLKEKQRKEKAKAEGRLLSKSQKQARARMEATLAALREQGIDVPQICDKKATDTHGPRLGNCKNFHRKRLDSCQSTQSSDSAVVITDRQKYESFSSQESSSKDSLSDFPSSLDLTEDSGLTQESDKNTVSCSKESDDYVVSSKRGRTKSESKTLIEKSTFLKRERTKSETKILIEKSDVKLLSLSHSPVSSEPNSNESFVKLRSPVVCVLGHVDTGKTKILDYIRKTHVQDSEAGGITQQIGATMIPHDALKEKCKMVKSVSSFDLKIPGLLVIDTPGHESFSNLRSRGSSICDIAVLVVDIMHGLEPQTIESINLLKKGKIPFVVALNKVDRIYGWKSSKDDDIEYTIKNQTQATQCEFKKRCQEIILQFANQCLNAALFYENNDPRSFFSMVPTSAISGDGMGNLLGLIAQLTQLIMPKKLIFSERLEATVLEVKAIAGLGTTIDVILVNGKLREGDTIVLAGQDGPIVTQIRSLLMPQPLKELRVKNPYIEHKFVEGAQGIKITGKDLEKSIAGLPLLVAENHNMIDSLKSEINSLFHDVMSSIKTSERGVYVQASTLGSLEALLEYFTSSGIPYFSVKIGPVVKKDVMKASIMLEHDVMYATILAFDVKIERDAQDLADSLGVKIFHADIIYHLFDMYVKYKEDLLLLRQEEIKRHAVFPCKLKIMPEFIFNVKDPIVLGVHIEAGTLKEGIPLCVVNGDIVEIGFVSSIEVNNNKVSCAKKGQDVCITVSPKPGDSPKTYGKHFSCEDILVSRISRQSIDSCKNYFRSELQPSDWHLMVELKKMLHIM